jgi:hypothetical protein
MATSKHSKSLLLENYGRNVALAPDLQKVSFNSAIEFLSHSSANKLLLFLILIKGSHPSSKALLPSWKSSSVL